MDEKCYFKLSSLNYLQISAAEFYKRRNNPVMTSSPKAKGDKPRKIYLLWVLINKYQNIWRKLICGNIFGTFLGSDVFCMLVLFVVISLVCNLQPLGSLV